MGRSWHSLRISSRVNSPASSTDDWWADRNEPKPSNQKSAAAAHQDKQTAQMAMADGVRAAMEKGGARAAVKVQTDGGAQEK